MAHRSVEQSVNGLSRNDSCKVHAIGRSIIDHNYYGSTNHTEYAQVMNEESHFKHEKAIPDGPILGKIAKNCSNKEAQWAHAKCDSAL